VDRATLGGIFNGIAEQVVDDLLDPDPVKEQRDRF
jgi:hypothetical protein